MTFWSLSSGLISSFWPLWRILTVSTLSLALFSSHSTLFGQSYLLISFYQPSKYDWSLLCISWLDLSSEALLRYLDSQADQQRQNLTSFPIICSFFILYLSYWYPNHQSRKLSLSYPSYIDRFKTLYPWHLWDVHLHCYYHSSGS